MKGARPAPRRGAGRRSARPRPAGPAEGARRSAGGTALGSRPGRRPRSCPADLSAQRARGPKQAPSGRCPPLRASAPGPLPTRSPRLHVDRCLRRLARCLPLLPLAFLPPPPCALRPAYLRPLVDPVWPSSFSSNLVLLDVLNVKKAALLFANGINAVLRNETVRNSVEQERSHGMQGPRNT